MTDMITCLYSLGSSILLKLLKEKGYSLFFLKSGLHPETSLLDAVLISSNIWTILRCRGCLWLFCFCFRLVLSLNLLFSSFLKDFLRSNLMAFDPGQCSGLVFWVPLRSSPDSHSLLYVASKKVVIFCQCSVFPGRLGLKRTYFQELLNNRNLCWISMFVCFKGFFMTKSGAPAHMGIVEQ